MNQAAKQQDETSELLSDSTLRGILLLGGLALVAFVGYKIWLQQKSIDLSNPLKPKLISVPIDTRYGFAKKHWATSTSP